MFAYSLRTDTPICTKLGMRVLWNQEEVLERSKPEELPWVRNPVTVSVSWKLSNIEECRQDRRCLFRRGNCRNRGSTTQKYGSWVRVLVKIVSIAGKLSMIEERRREQNCLFRRGDYRNKGHRPETVLGSSLGEDWFRNDNFFLWYSAICIELSGLW
jgi:hypothetical protein